MNIEAIEKFLWYSLDDIGANNLTPAGVVASRTMCENSPKNRESTISI